MKILHIIPSLQTGGAERLALDICSELSKRTACEVLLIVFSENIHFKKPGFYKHIAANISLSVLKKNKFDIEKLQKEIELFKPDIIHSHLFYADIVSRSIFYPKAVWFSHFHDNMPQLQNFNLATLLNKKNLVNFYEKQYLLKRYKKNGSNHFISISKDTTQYIEKVLPKHFKQYYLKNAIEFDKFKNTNKTFSTEKLKLINVGSFQAKKNQQLLISVAEILYSKNIAFELTFLGEGEHFNEVKEKTTMLNLNAYVRFEGNVNNVETYLKKADIYVHSAYYEPFGLVLIEAMAAGLTVVTLDGKGNRDIIEEGKNGYMIYEQDAEKFADTIIKLWENKEKMQEISNYATEYAKQYDIVNYVDKLLELYQNAINSK